MRTWPRRAERRAERGVLRCYRFPGEAAAVQPMAAEPWSGGGAQGRGGKCQAGRKSVGQHVIQKEARETSEDVHGAEGDQTELRGQQKQTHGGKLHRKGCKINPKKIKIQEIR